MDAQIPQTAKVDRSTATTNVNYNGDPQFAPVQGTDMQYATNTSSSVILDKGIYYSVDNGVWFQAPAPSGPWTVATERPADVDGIPPSSPLYNVKYVYVYDVTPQYVYMGYTPGYMNTFIYGPTVVYGTGFYYNPWINGFYYPRAWTWGFNMCYNPWCGWSMGFGYGFGWFHGGIGFGGGWGHGGWWGPSAYRPPYVWNRARTFGYYGTNFARNRNVFVNNYRTNIYANRGGVITRNITNVNRPFAGTARPQGGINNRPGVGAPGGARPVTTTGGRPGQANNVYSDRSGNVYQRNQTNNQWQQRQSNNQWKPVSNNSQSVQNLNRAQQQRDRGQTRSQNFQSARSGGSAPRATSAPRSSGGSSGGGRRGK
jgi:hypothetical protein